MSWDRPFAQPVPLPGGRPARTLRDAGDFVSKLSRLERDTPEWRYAVEMLIDAAEDRGAILLAKIGLDRALDRKIKQRCVPGASGSFLTNSPQFRRMPSNNH
jgi:hypothetical protein